VSLNRKQLINLLICVFGIQFGSALQVANLSAIFKELGAATQYVSVLWLVAPITGLFTQPIIGVISDNYRSRFGSRRPIMFICMVLSVVSMVLLPNVSTLWLAVILAWFLDAGTGIYQPLRALIIEKTEKRERPLAFGWFAVFSGLGAIIASTMPYLFNLLTTKNVYELTNTENHIPLNVKWAFYAGAVAFLIFTLWTLIHTEETPRPKEKHTNNIMDIIKHKLFKSFMEKLKDTSVSIKRTAVIQFFAWIGMFSVWSYINLTIAQNYFGLPVIHPEASPQYQTIMLHAVTWTGLTIGLYEFVNMLFNLSFPKLADKYSVRLIYAVALLIGAISLMVVTIFHQKAALLITMSFFGITWGAILSCPYTLASADLQGKDAGFYFGIFNAAVTLPQIVGGIIFGFSFHNLLHSSAANVLRVGACSLLIASLIAFFQWKKFDREAN